MYIRSDVATGDTDSNTDLTPAHRNLPWGAIGVGTVSVLGLPLLYWAYRRGHLPKQQHCKACGRKVPPQETLHEPEPNCWIFGGTKGRCDACWHKWKKERSGVGYDDGEVE